ncbi:MAG: class I SAM-dependent methyltransferase [Candidatus Didemnitutus sp.]|nr:class I SAM-dependent methyltransferase [Candidatus Didemnitutus sp.]
MKNLSFKLILLWFRGRILRNRAALWNYQYAVGRWEKLKASPEEARLEATAHLLRRHVPAGRVLEIGCGEALLQQRLRPEDYREWLGVDISEVAIQRAQAFAGPNVRYLAADMETLDPDGKFDAIVFTESIYAVPDRVKLLRRYTHFLSPAGLFIVSICRSKRGPQYWSEIHQVTAMIDAITTTNERGIWDCEVLRPMRTE